MSDLSAEPRKPGGRPMGLEGVAADGCGAEAAGCCCAAGCCFLGPKPKKLKILEAWLAVEVKSCCRPARRFCGVTTGTHEVGCIHVSPIARRRPHKSACTRQTALCHLTAPPQPSPPLRLTCILSSTFSSCLSTPGSALPAATCSRSRFTVVVCSSVADACFMILASRSNSRPVMSRHRPRALPSGSPPPPVVPVPLVEAAEAVLAAAEAAAALPLPLVPARLDAAAAAGVRSMEPPLLRLLVVEPGEERPLLPLVAGTAAGAAAAAAASSAFLMYLWSAARMCMCMRTVIAVEDALCMLHVSMSARPLESPLAPSAPRRQQTTMVAYLCLSAS